MRDGIKPRGSKIYLWVAGVAVLLLLLIAACGDGDGEDRPGIRVIESETGSVSATGTGTGTGTVTAIGTGTMTGTGTDTVTATGTGTMTGTGTDTVTATGTGTMTGTGTGTVTATETGTMTGTGTDTVTATGTGTMTGTGTGAVTATGTGTMTGTGTGAVTATGTGTMTGTGTGTVSGPGETRGLFIPVNLPLETSGPTKSDGYYAPTTNREHYQKISTDYQEIAALTNVINEGKPLPAAEIWLLYEVGMHTRIGPRSKSLQSFATGSERAEEYSDAAEFYGSDTFLDDTIENVVRGRREAEDYTDAQRRQAINKGLLRIIYHWSKHYMIAGCADLDSGDVDEGWAAYVGEEVNGEYPNSLAATAQARENNFGRQGTIDIPLRQAMELVRQAADNGDAPACEAAAQQVYSRFNAIFYLSTVRYIGRVLDDAQAGDHDSLGTHQVEALAFYQSIQPDVAKANPASNDTIVAYLEAAPDQITPELRDQALAALNGAASGILLTQDDLITSFDADTGAGASDVASPYTGPIATSSSSSSVFIPVGLPLETSGPTKSDGYYAPTTNREHYQKISTDYQEIAALTNVINEGKPLPAAEIWLLYEAGMHTRIGPRSKSLQSFATGSERAEEYSDAAEFYGSDTFLDDTIENVVRGRREAEDYTDAQRRQAINKGLLRIIYHWSKHYMIAGCADLDSGDVDEGWAAYVGEEVNGEYPNSLAATAQARENNFGRQGTIDIPLRQAMELVRQAADNADAPACEAAAQQVYSRFNAIFYLSTVRYIGRVLDDAQAGDHDSLGTHQVEALAFYQSIQPDVAKANPASNDTIVAYLEADPDQITPELRDQALAALNGAAPGLLLTQDDLVTSFE